jgi:predicted Zn-dependent protease
MHKAAKKLFSRREALRLIGLGGSAFLVPMLGGCAVDPVTGRQQMVMMSPEQEIALDRQRSPFQYSADYGQVQDIWLNGYLDRVGREVAAHSHRPEMPYSFRAVNAPYINAYAFPGGSIATTRGILVELENEAELAALLGHEIGHVSARHTAEQTTQGALVNILIAGAAMATGAAGHGNYAGIIRDVGGIGAGALLAHYSRENEREADALGMEYMTRTGYTPRGMIGLTEILLKNGRQNPNAVELMFATHPMSEERYRTAVRVAEERYRRMLSAPDRRERYMDHTAGLRSIKGAITAMQNGTEAMGKKKYREAEEQYSRALAIAPNDYTALVMLSKCKLAQEETGEAERLALRAARIYPQEAQARTVSGLASIINGRYEQAYAQFTEYNRLLPGNPEAGFFRGLALEGMGRRREAAGFYYQYLQQVREGQQARYAYRKLQNWGYLR